MRRRLLASYLVLTVVILLLLEVPLGLLEARQEHDALAASARRDATALSVVAAEELADPGKLDLDDLATRYRQQAGSEVAIMDREGRVLVAFDPDDANDRSNELEPVMRRALTGATYTARRTDEGAAQLVAIQPVHSDDQVVGAVAVAVSATASDDRINRAWLGLTVLGGLLLAIAAAIGVVLARSISAPITRLRSTAIRFGAGELDARVTAGGPPEVAELSMEFNHMAQRVAELVDSQRRLVADASHQLRTPLTSIRLRLENLTADLPGDASADDIGEIQSEVDRLSRLVDGLLALSRAEHQAESSASADVHSVVGDRVQAWSALAEERGVTLAGPTARSSGPSARIDPSHLEQVLDNLLANALEVSPTGSTIAIDVEPGPEEVRVHVRDQGLGMSDDDRHRAFDRFWQGTNHETGSSGLGLSIVRELVTAAGGDISLEPITTGIDAVVTLLRADLGTG